MSRYKIWDRITNIITPIGEVLTPDQWIKRYPVANIYDTVCGGGEINGNIFEVYSSFKNMYARMGCDFSGCETKQDYLDAIERFEDEQASIQEISIEERTAAALELIALENMPDVEEELEEEEFVEDPQTEEEE